MAYIPMFPKPDANRKKKSGFRQFRNEREFEACLSKLIREDRNVLIDLGRR